jgi:hypothetical protein
MMGLCMTARETRGLVIIAQACTGRALETMRDWLEKAKAVI